MTNSLCTPARPQRAMLRLAAVGAAAALALAGCGSDDSTPPAADSPSSPADQSEPATQAPVVTEEPTDVTEEPTDTTEEPTETDDDSGSGVEAGEIPAPGTEVEVGDTITTHVQTPGEKGDEYFGYATLATTVTDVEKGDPKLFQDAENAADFKGYTPWFVHVEHEWLTYEGEPNDNMIPRIVAFNESGGDVSTVINSTWSGGIPDCELVLPDTKGVGEKATNCHVFAVPDGEAIGSVGWPGDDYADGDGSATDNPYQKDPVLWLVP